MPNSASIFTNQLPFQTYHGNKAAYVLDGSGTLTYYNLEPQIPYHVQANVTSFVADSPTSVYYTDFSHSLWHYSNEWSNPSPAAVPREIEKDVKAFYPTPAGMLILDGGNTLWLNEPLLGTNPAHNRIRIDENVTAFSEPFVVTDAWMTAPESRAIQKKGILKQIFVLRDDGNLWLRNLFLATFNAVAERPLNPPEVIWWEPQQVDATVSSFQAFDRDTLAILGNDGNLWFATSPWGQVPPSRQQIDANVWTFISTQGTGEFAIIGRDGLLWWAQGPWGQVPPQRTLIDATAQAAYGTPDREFFVLGQDGKLWYEYARFGSVPPERIQVGATINGGFCANVDPWRVAPRHPLF